MGQKAKWEYFRAIYQRCRQADRKRKHAILNEFCVNTGYPRDTPFERPASGPRSARRAAPATPVEPNRERCWEKGKPQ